MIYYKLRQSATSHQRRHQENGNRSNGDFCCPYNCLGNLRTTKITGNGRSLGKAIREFKSVGSEIQDEITKVTDEIDIDPEKTIKPPKSA